MREQGWGRYGGSAKSWGGGSPESFSGAGRREEQLSCDQKDDQGHFRDAGKTREQSAFSKLEKEGKLPTQPNHRGPPLALDARGRLSSGCNKT